MTAAASNERVRPVRTAAVFAFAIPPRDRGGSGLRAGITLPPFFFLLGLCDRPLLSSSASSFASLQSLACQTTPLTFSGRATRTPQNVENMEEFRLTMQ